MNNSRSRKLVLYIAIILMIPTFVIAIFFKHQFPVLGPVLATCGIILLAIISFIDYRNKRG